MKEKPFLILCILCLFALIPGCETTSPEVKLSASRIEKSLPQSKLAYYNDTFDKMRDDLWSKAALVFTKGQLSNFKLADMTIVNGRLKIETQRGSFSKGAFLFKYALRGDFDIQVDCHIDFLGGVYDMDQVAAFVAHEKGLDFKTINSAVVQAMKTPDWYRGRILSFQKKSGKSHRGESYELGSFRGTFRIIRKGNKASTLYRLAGKAKWKELDTFSFTTNDVLVGFLLQNFTPKRTSITAESSITALFDNFRINAAQEIVEEEI